MNPKSKAHVLLGASLALAVGRIGFAAEEATAGATPPANESPPPRRLDLTIPDIRTLYTEEQIAAILAPTRNDQMDEVEVEGQRGPRLPVTPEVWGGIAAPLWAVLHPTQAWRIFAPLPPDQARRLQNEKPDATAPYQTSAARSAASP